MSSKLFSSRSTTNRKNFNASIARNQLMSSAGCVKIATIFSSAISATISETVSKVYMPIPTKSIMFIQNCSDICRFELFQFLYYVSGN